ncbi:hypothetical protein FIU93_10680 [Labrenzia sp. THAF35]|nr:hypothetical protein FIU93_10680 [Labrenzia sp. THAF35]
MNKTSFTINRFTKCVNHSTKPGICRMNHAVTRLNHGFATHSHAFEPGKRHAKCVSFTKTHNLCGHFRVILTVVDQQSRADTHFVNRARNLDEKSLNRSHPAINFGRHERINLGEKRLHVRFLPSLTVLVTDRLRLWLILTFGRLTSESHFEVKTALLKGI